MNKIEKYCKFVIEPIDKEKQAILHKDSISELDEIYLEKYDDLLFDKYTKLAKMIEEVEKENH